MSVEVFKQYMEIWKFKNLAQDMLDCQMKSRGKIRLFENVIKPRDPGVSALLRWWL